MTLASAFVTSHPGTDTWIVMSWSAAVAEIGAIHAWAQQHGQPPTKASVPTASVKCPIFSLPPLPCSSAAFMQVLGLRGLPNSFLHTDLYPPLPGDPKLGQVAPNLFVGWTWTTCLHHGQCHSSPDHEERPLRPPSKAGNPIT